MRLSFLAFCFFSKDYDTAKLLKEAETQLKSLGQQLAQLEVAKRQAVEDEDYDRAKMLKVRKTATYQTGGASLHSCEVSWRKHPSTHDEHANHRAFWP